MMVPGPSGCTTDPRWARPATTTWLDRFFLRRIRDERDLLFVHRATAISLTVWPLAVGMFLLPPWVTWLLAVPYLAFVFVRWGAAFTLMLHAVCHRPLFRREHAAWERWIPWLIGPFLGHTPSSFYVHHIGMHHPENNLEADLSCTLAYQRDELAHFLHYWARFFWV